jgi:bacterioferritin (cytochrome b1)
MDNNKTNEVIEILNKIMEYELSGVVRYNRKRQNKSCSIF